jgi:glycosyltransferase involved in cell wall biosynthesis
VKNIKIAILQTPTSGLNLRIHGGMERIELCQLYGLLERGYNARFYVSKLIEGKSPYIKSIRAFNHRNRILNCIYYIIFIFLNFRVDIYHGFFTPLLALFAPKKTITHFQGNAIFELPLYRYFKKRYNTSYYVFLSEYTKREFEKKYSEIKASQLFLIHNCVDTNHFKPLMEIPSKDPSKTCICFYGGWIPEKGIFDILSAAEILEKKRLDFRIYLGGSAFSHYKDSIWGNSADIDKKVREWVGRLKTVEIVGDIEYQQLPNFINGMDIGLMPSSYPEPFGIVNIEIMACEKPIIATRVGGIPEIVDDGVNGYLVSPNKPEEIAQKIELFLENKDLIKTMGLAAREKVMSHFTLERYLDSITKLYKAILCAQGKNVVL